jgi:hypothetical protein
MKRTLLLSLTALSLAAIPLACGSYSSDNNGTGGSAAGGSTGGTGGTSTGGTSSGGTKNGGTSAGGTSAGGSTGGTSNGGTSNGGSTGGTSSGGSTGGTGGTSTGGSNGGSTGGTSSGGSTGGTSAGGTSAGGSTGGSTAGNSGTAGAAGPTLPSDVFTKAGNTVVSAHSTVRVIVTGYTGPLYELCKGTANPGPASCKGTKQNVGSKDGYADVEVHKAFCPGTGSGCTITKIFDQSGKGNDLEPAPRGGVCGADMPANANDLLITINGHSAYGIKIVSKDKGGVGHGYRAGCTECTNKKGNGVPLGDDPETMYMITSQKDLYNGCCFDYGNAETTSTDNKNGTMETLYFGGGVWWGTGSSGARETDGQWLMADLEDGLYAGWDSVRKSDQKIATNTPLKYDFVTGVLVGDTADKNAGKGRFALFGGDATTGTLKTLYDGIRPEKPGYAPAKKEGSIILGIGGDNSCSAGGDFFEGLVGAGPVFSKEAVDSLQTVIVSAKYEKFGN